MAGQVLPPGKALEQYTKFNNQYGNPNFPQAVVFTVDELQTYLERANSMFDEQGVQANERGISLCYGIQLVDPAKENYNKPTLMLVATQFKEDALHPGKVEGINNPVSGLVWPGTEPAPTTLPDYCYDGTCTFP